MKTLPNPFRVDLCPVISLSVLKEIVATVSQRETKDKHTWHVSYSGDCVTITLTITKTGVNEEPHRVIFRCAQDIPVLHHLSLFGEDGIMIAWYPRLRVTEPDNPAAGKSSEWVIFWKPLEEEVERRVNARKALTHG